MNLHIELDASHPAYAWLTKQADKIGAKGHFGTHIDCIRLSPLKMNFTCRYIFLIAGEECHLYRKLPIFHPLKRKP